MILISEFLTLASMPKGSSTKLMWVSSFDAFSPPIQFGIGGRSRHMTVIGGVAALLAKQFLALYFATLLYRWKIDPVYSHSMIKSFRKDDNKETIPILTFIPTVLITTLSQIEG